MMRRITHFKNKIFKTGRVIYGDDIFLVSYPKSGNTWLRFLLAYCLFDIEPGRVNFHNIENFIPDMYVNWPNRNLARPRIIKSHEKFTKNYPRVIYLYRDGRDVMVSYYYHSRLGRYRFLGIYEVEYHRCFNRRYLYGCEWSFNYHCNWKRQHQGTKLGKI